MIDQLSYYQLKLLNDGQLDPDGLLLIAQDEEQIFCGSSAHRELCAQVLELLGGTVLIAGAPQFPYLELLFAGLPPTADCAIPLDTETRTFLHDIPLIRRDELSQRGAASITERLSQRKGVIVEGLGLVAAGALTIEQGYVNFCSLLHATTVKVLLDLLREPLPEQQLLHDMAPLWAALRTPLQDNTDELKFFDSQDAQAVLTAIETAGRRTVELGLVDSFFGNISVAVDGAIYISQTAASLDRLSGCVDHVMNDDSSCTGLTASSELAAHRAIFAETGARTLLHGHPRFSVILSLLCEEKECKTADCWKDCAKIRELGGVPVVAGEVGAGGLARNLPPVMGTRSLALVYGHGVFAIGRHDFSEPLSAMINFENWCRNSFIQRLEQSLLQQAGQQ